MSSNQPQLDLEPLRERHNELMTDLGLWTGAAKVDDVAGLLAHPDAQGGHAVNFAILAERKRAMIQRELNTIASVLAYFSNPPPPPPPPIKAPVSAGTAAFVFAVWFGLLVTVYLGLLIAQH